MPNLVDSHAHIYDQKFEEDLEQVNENCREQGISRIYMPNIDLDSIERMLLLEQKYPDLCIPMMGLHPGSVDDTYDKKLKTIEKWLNERAFAAVGEAGLDLYWDKTYFEQQIKALETQVEWAKSGRLPIILHFREAFTETYQLIRKHQNGNLNGIFHCFTGTAEEAEMITDLNFYLGIGGVVTFKNAGLDRALSKIPLEKLLLETDSPYLSPAPYRGKRNDPGKLVLIADKLAEIYQVSSQEIAEITSGNAFKLFNL